MRYLLFLLLPSVCFGQVLKSSGGGNALNISNGTTGDLPYQSAANTTAFLAAGTTNQVLLGGTSAPSWSGAPQFTSIGIVGSVSTRIPFINTSQNLATDANFKYSSSGRLDIDGGYTIFNQPGGSTVINAATIDIGNNNGFGTTTLQSNGGKVAVGIGAPASTFHVNGSAQFGTSVKPSSFTATGQGIIAGTATNDSAAAGYIGEYLSNNLGGAQTPPASAGYVAIATVTFTAGDWDVSALGDMSAGATTAATQIGCSISTSNTSRSGTAAGQICEIAATFAVSKETTCNIPMTRISVASSTAYYLVCQITYTTLGGATWTTDSILQGRRVR